MKFPSAAKFCFLVFSGALSLLDTLRAAPAISLTTDRDNALYACGEPATFIVEVTDDGVPAITGFVQVKIGAIGGETLINQKFDLSKGNPVRLTSTLKTPGFLLAAATAGPDVPKALSGAGFDPKGIISANDLPKDFKSFWETGRKAIADNPVKLEKLDAFSTPQYTSYAVTVEVLNGERLYGFLTIPGRTGKYPAVVTIPGAGPGIAEPKVDWARRKVISLVMNVHKFPVILGDAKANKRQYKERNAVVSYSLDQADNRDRYHFRNVILGIDRAITEIAGRSDWDGRHLVLDGSSQGGGLSLILAGFNPHITAVAANVPALGDHGAARFHRAPGWPKLAQAGPKALAISPYYDAANFARSIHVPALVSVGFIDVICPPASVYAVYNRIPNERKTILDMPGQGHGISDVYRAVKAPWINRQLGLENTD